MNIDKHKNMEKIIRYYLLFLPPRGCQSILNIGCGINDPYGGNLRARTKEYKTLDVRKSEKVNYDYDITKQTPFKNDEFEWVWCVETIEHLNNKKLEAVKEIMRICKNCIFTYPLPSCSGFNNDPGHTEVEIDWEKEFSNDYYIEDKTTKTGRAIIILTDKKLGTWKELKEKEEKYIPKNNKTKIKIEGYFK